MNTGLFLTFLTLFIPVSAFLFYFAGVKIANIAGGVANTSVAVLLYFFRPPVGLFFVDFTTWVFIIMVTAISFMSSLYATRYFKGSRLGIKEETFHLLMALFTTSMIFSLEINNYGLMWVGIEATTISSALLLITDKTETSLEATWRYLVIVSAGVTFAFFSIILIYYSAGTLEVSSVLAVTAGAKSSPILKIAVAIALIGFGTKVGVFPVHTWLPDAHSEAPSPVSAMFSGVLLPTALYVLYRIYEIDPLRDLYVWFGVISVVAASIFLGYQTRYKRMFAYSTMENMNLALIGLASGGIAGITGALLLLISHSFGKAGAFYSSGNVLKATGKKGIADINGLWNSMPMTSGSMLLSSLAVTGTPPFGTFFGEFLILYNLLALHYYIQFVIVLFFLMTAFISVNLNVSKMIFRGESDYSEPDRVMPLISMVSSIMPIVIGIVFLVMTIEMV